MKKFLFFALAMIATCVLFNSCKTATQAQPLVEWGFENTDQPGAIDHVGHGEFTYKYAFQAIENEIESNANWKAQDELAVNGLMARLTPTTEENIKKELTDIFETAIKKAEDTMKEMNYVLDTEKGKITILAQYKFTVGDSQTTTLKFYIPFYRIPEKE
ncbi:MAG: hypothetical protein MJZ89_04295 [Paludibacteraceae bacterium]|nr:hypothetical protein [Paludibacteraceae bacterium]